jgi:hypothetical protein
MRYTTRQDAIKQAIIPALGEFGHDYDIEGLAAEILVYKVDTDEHGNERLNTAGFELTVEGDEFWAAAKRYDTTA